MENSQARPNESLNNKKEIERKTGEKVARVIVVTRFNVVLSRCAQVADAQKLKRDIGSRSRDTEAEMLSSASAAAISFPNLVRIVVMKVSIQNKPLNFFSSFAALACTSFAYFFCCLFCCSGIFFFCLSFAIFCRRRFVRFSRNVTSVL